MGLEKILALSAAATLTGCVSFNEKAWLEKNKNISSTPLVHNSSTDARVVIYGYDGFGNHMMRYFDDSFPLAQKFQPVNLFDYPRYMNDIVKDYAEGNHIILLGHSMGCEQAVSVARHLDALNIPVDLVMLDAVYANTSIPFVASSIKISDNVGFVLHLYSNGPYEGKHMDDSFVDDPSRTVLYNEHFSCGHGSFMFGKQYSYLIDWVNEVIDLRQMQRQTNVLTSQQH